MKIPTLTFTDPPGMLDFATACRHFADSPLGQAAAVKLEGMRTHFRFDRCIIAAKTFQASIIFEARNLSLIELFLILPGDKQGWSNWSQEGEQRRKEEGERWLESTFGQPAAVEPYELDGKQIAPFHADWDHPRSIFLPWGKVTSYFDSKAGFAGIRIACPHPDRQPV